MDALKQEIRDTVGLDAEHPEEAERYGIDWNGILLYGPPGVGKTFFAQAIAGEYGLNFIHVSTGDLIVRDPGRLGTEHRQGVRDRPAEPALPALLRRVRLRRAAARQPARSGVAANGEPAPHLARGASGEQAAARDGGDELARAARPRGRPSRPVRPPRADRSAGRGRAPRDLRAELDDRPTAPASTSTRSSPGRRA